MYCPNCGTPNNEGASFCVHCSGPLPRVGGHATMRPTPMYRSQIPVRIPNYMTFAVLVTVFAALFVTPLAVFGIPAIVYSARANRKTAQGDYAGAYAAARNALIWCWVPIGLTVLLVPLVILILMIQEGSGL